MKTREDAARLRDQLLAVLSEDAHNTERLMGRLDALARERGIGAHAALLLILTQLAFEEGEARRHWESILEHRALLSAAVARDVGLRVAVVDYFLNVNRRLLQPTLIDLAMFESIERTGHLDPLTGLSGDRTFRIAVQNELRRGRRHEGQVAVAMFDLDGFADVNRTAGRLVGDRLLREAAILLQNKVRDIDLPARPREDELALLMPGTDRHGALLVADRFRAEVERHFASRDAAGAPLHLTVSAGVACYPADALTPEALLERAASALYAAKASGKNTVLSWRLERRRYVRFELEPGRFEIEVLAPRELRPCPARDHSRNGILFESPEPLEVGERIEIRLLGSGEEGRQSGSVRGWVVRLEEIPGRGGAHAAGDAPPSLDRFEVGVVLENDGSHPLLERLDRARGGGAERPS